MALAPWEVRVKPAARRSLIFGSRRRYPSAANRPIAAESVEAPIPMCAAKSPGLSGSLGFKCASNEESLADRWCTVLAARM
jgi:hypothetical protein